MDWFSMMCADDVDINSFQAWEAMKAGQDQQQQEEEGGQQQQQGGGGEQGAEEGAVDYWVLQREFYRTGVANAPDPPPKEGVDEQAQFRERFEGEEEQQQPLGGAEQQGAAEQQEQVLLEGAEQQGAVMVADRGEEQQLLDVADPLLQPAQEAGAAQHSEW